MRHPWQEGVTTSSDRVSQRTTILGEDTLEIGEGEIPRYMKLETVIIPFTSHSTSTHTTSTTSISRIIIAREMPDGSKSKSHI